MKKLYIIVWISLFFLVPNAALAQQTEEARGYKFTQESLDELKEELSKDEQELPATLEKKLKAEILNNEYLTMEKVDIALNYALQGYPAYKSKALKYVKRIGVDMGGVVDILVMFLVLAVVFEMAFATIFEWKYFQENLDNKGLKTPIMLLLVFLIFWRYDLNIFTQLLDAFGKSVPSSDLLGRIATAFLIAGGSKGIWEIFNRLGIRNPYTSHTQPYNPAYKSSRT